MTNFFTSQGFDVTSLTDFRQIENQVTKLQPDLIILDLGLPGIDGQVVMQRIRQTSQIPIMIVTCSPYSSSVRIRTIVKITKCYES